ncbi:hypothetical protein TNCV_2355301 [Trichonephila clavipes]|nr:hypothetical protein TNCV_2355301 [Trichonephila clavipes]
MSCLRLIFVEYHILKARLPHLGLLITPKKAPLPSLSSSGAFADGGRGAPPLINCPFGCWLKIPKPDEFGDVFEKVVVLAWQIRLEVVGVQKLPELTTDGLVEMHEQAQHIEKLYNQINQQIE